MNKPVETIPPPGMLPSMRIVLTTLAVTLAVTLAACGSADLQTKAGGGSTGSAGGGTTGAATPTPETGGAAGYYSVSGSVYTTDCPFPGAATDFSSPDWILQWIPSRQSYYISPDTKWGTRVTTLTGGNELHFSLAPYNGHGQDGCSYTALTTVDINIGAIDFDGYATVSWSGCQTCRTQFLLHGQK